jgi:sulfate transport system ATP-binding protein
LEIVVDGESAGVPARVNRILSVGPLARVELSGLNGSGAGAGSQFFEVELPSKQLSELNLSPGQTVRLSSSRLRVFQGGART